MGTIILAAQQQGGSSMGFIFLILMFVVLYFFMIRPQQKRQKEIQKFQNSLTEGSQVMTGGGLYGTVKRIDLAANILEVEIAKGVTVRVDRNYVFKDPASTQTAK